MDNTTKMVKAAVENYTGSLVKDIKVHDDPIVNGSYAVRAVVVDSTGTGMTQDYVVCARPDGRQHTVESMVDNMEEANFKSWPPVSGRMRFFL